MRLRVHCEEWVLGDRGYGVAVGDSFSEWLVLDDDEGRTAELRATYEALVTPLKPWEGLALGYHAYRLDIGPVPVYCEWAEEMDPGPGVVTGVLSVDTYVAPPDWPRTTGVVVRMWTEHRRYVQDPAGDGTWVFESPSGRYEEVEQCVLSRDRGLFPRGRQAEQRTGALLEIDVDLAGESSLG